jgi:hypothetical protein
VSATAVASAGTPQWPLICSRMVCSSTWSPAVLRVSSTRHGLTALNTPGRVAADVVGAADVALASPNVTAHDTNVASATVVALARCHRIGQEEYCTICSACHVR